MDDMFLHKKNGTIVAQFAVLLIIALIMIFAVTSFGARIWSAFFPSADKSALQSFETVNTMINAVMASPFDYESNTLGIYMAKNYEMVFFDKSSIDCKVITTRNVDETSNTVTTEGKNTYYAPEECESYKCLCLYDDDPHEGEKKKEKHVMKCHTFKEDINKININPQFFELNDGVCGRDVKKYSSLIIASRVEDDKKRYLYILKDNEVNQGKDAEWDVPMCADPGNVGGICSGHKADSIVPIDEKNFDDIYSYCSNIEGKSYKSTSVKCAYDKSQTKCTIECADGDITKRCGTTYTQCSDFNKDTGIVKYMDPQADYGNYQLCVSDDKYCGLGCTASNWITYICPSSVTGAIDSSCTLPQGCNEEYLAMSGKLQNFLKSYNTSKVECKDFVDKTFHKDMSTILECKGDLIECKNFILKKKSECSIKYISNSDSGYIYWITNYDAACESDVKNLFDAAQFCIDKPTTSPATP